MLNKPLSQLKVGELVYSLDFVGHGKVTLVLPHEFHLEIVSGKNIGDKAAYPFTSDATAFDAAQPSALEPWWK